MRSASYLQDKQATKTISRVLHYWSHVVKYQLIGIDTHDLTGIPGTRQPLNYQRIEIISVTKTTSKILWLNNNRVHETNQMQSRLLFPK